MQTFLNKLPSLLNQSLSSLYCLCGDEILLVQEACDSIRTAAREQNFTDKIVFNVNGANYAWDQILLAIQSPGLFAEKQIIEIRIPSGKPGREGAVAIKKLTELLLQNQDICCIITLPKLDQTSKNSVWFKALEQSGITFTVPKIERKDLPQWIAQRLSKNRLQIPTGQEGKQLLEFFADTVEGNLLAANQEIEKLSLIFGTDTSLSFDQVKNSVLNVARFDVFRLSEAILGGQAKQVQRILEGLQQEGASEVLVHWVIAEDILLLNKIKTAQVQGTPIALALRNNRVWGLKEKLVERIMPRITTVQTSNLLQAAHIVDGVVKGIIVANWPKNSWQALHKLAMMLCEIAALPPNIQQYKQLQTK